MPYAADKAPSGGWLHIIWSFLYLYSTSVVVGLATGAAIVWLLLFFKRTGLSASKVCLVQLAYSHESDLHRKHDGHNFAAACTAFPEERCLVDGWMDGCHYYSYGLLLDLDKL